MKKHKNMLVFVVAIAFIATVTLLLAPVNQQVAEAQTDSNAAAAMAASQQERLPLEEMDVSQVGRDQDAGQRAGGGLGPLNITELKRTGGNRTPWNWYGGSVSVSDNVAVVGNPGDTDNGFRSGSVFVLQRDGNTWPQNPKLLASDGSYYDQFGYSVSVDGEVIVAGAPYGRGNNNSSRAGAAYVFAWNGSEWVQAPKITADDGQPYDYFGHSVSISGDIAVVGAPYDDDDGSSSGSAYVFRWNGSSWLQEAKLTADDAERSDYFGYSVSISGNVALVGAHGDRGDNNIWGQGAVYAFRWNGSEWQQQARLTANDGGSGDYFGVSVSISNDVALVGAYGDKSSYNNWYEGSAYLFRWSGTEWVEEEKLKGESGRYEFFGYSVSVTDDKALVGAYGNNYNSSSSRQKGAGYLYRYNSGTSQWEQGAKLQASDGARYDYFARSVGLSDDVAIAGAIGDDDNGSNSGSAYLYLLDTSPPAPNMSLSGSSFWVTLRPGDSTTEEVTINNLGAGDLNWSASSDSAWLSPTPSSGTSTSASPGSVTLNIDATDLEPGEYEGRLTITAGGQTTTVLVWLTVSARAGVPIVSPAYGFDDVPTLIYIQGSGFDDSTTVTLGSEELEIKYVESGLISALVPAGLDPGEYNVTVQTGSNDPITVPNAYEVIRSSTAYDLVSSSDWLWTDPTPLRVGVANSSVGLNVQYLGSRNTIDNVTVEFTLDSPVGPLLGRELTNVIKPFGIEPTGKVVWEPEAAGEYIVCATIDPDNEIEESNEENNTVCRTLTVLEGGPDVMPPEVQNPDGFVISDDVLTTPEVTSTLDITATDNPGGLGVLSLKYIEFEYILGAHRWVPVQRTPWITYTTAYSDYPWQLIPTYGMRYMQGWVADAAGNISLKPGVDVIDLLPSEQAGSIAKNGVDFYRVLLEEGDVFTATLDPVDGDPDLYVWGPNGQLWYDQPQTGVEQVVIDDAPVKGTYQIEVHGFTDAKYKLNFGATDVPLSRFSNATPSRAGGRDVPEEPAVPLDDWPEFFDVEAAPVLEEIVEPGDGSSTIYLPITMN